MRAFVPDFSMTSPASLQEAFALYAQADDWTLFAGGTDLMVLFEAGAVKKARFLDLSMLKELHGVRMEPKAVVIGALTTYDVIREHAVLNKEFPNLCAAAALTGSIAIQNRGTIGGNIANASPAGDSLPALLAYDAVIVVNGKTGERRLPYADFHLGYKKTALRPGELISAVILPRGPEKKHYYRKVGTRKAQAISKVVMAGVAARKGDVFTDVRLAVGSVGPKPLRCVQTEAVFEGKKLTSTLIREGRATFMTEISPIDDIRSTERYRLEVAGNLLQEFISSI